MNGILIYTQENFSNTQRILSWLEGSPEFGSPLYLFAYAYKPFQLSEKKRVLFDQLLKKREALGLHTCLVLDTKSPSLLEGQITALIGFLESNEAGHVLMDHCLPLQEFFTLHNHALKTQNQNNYLCVANGHELGSLTKTLKTTISDFTAFSAWKYPLLTFLTNPPSLNFASKHASKIKNLQLYLSDIQTQSKLESITPTKKLLSQAFWQKPPVLLEGLLQLNPFIRKPTQWETLPFGPSYSLNNKMQKTLVAKIQRAAYLTWLHTHTSMGSASPILQLGNAIDALAKKNLPFINIVAAGVMCGALAITLPAFILHQNLQADTQKSLVSLKKTSEALNHYKQDYGHPPSPHTWLFHAKAYWAEKGPNLTDPTYKKLTRTDQPNNPGWGMNTKLHITLNTHNESEAILLGPSYHTKFSPKFDGTQKLQPLSASNSTPTDHTTRIGSSSTRAGWSGLYATVSGAILNLNPRQASALLKSHPRDTTSRWKLERDPYWAYPEAGFDRANPAPPPNSAPEQNLLTTSPLVDGVLELPPNSQTLVTRLASPTLLQTLQFKILATEKSEIIMQTQPKNKFLQIINCPNGAATQLSRNYSEYYHIFFDPLPTESQPTKLAINPLFGNSDRVLYLKKATRISPTEVRGELPHLQISLGKNTPLGIFEDTTKTFSLKIPPQKWTSFKIDAPIYNPLSTLSFLDIILINPTASKMSLKNLKVID